MRTREAMSRFMPALALFVGVVVAWEAVARIFKLPEFVLPPPTAIIDVLVAQQRELGYAAYVTAREVFWGFLLSGVIGAGVALVIARFATFGRARFGKRASSSNSPPIAST